MFLAIFSKLLVNSIFILMIYFDKNSLWVKNSLIFNKLTAFMLYVLVNVG